MRTSLMVSNFAWSGRLEHELATVARLADTSGIDPPGSPGAR